MKWLPPGAESSYEKFLSRMKVELSNLIESNRERYFADAEKEYLEQRNKDDEKIEEFNRWCKPRQIKKRPRRTMDGTPSDELLRSLGLYVDFKKAYFEYLEQVLSSIDACCYISELNLALLQSLNLDPYTSHFTYTSPILSTEYHNHLSDSILADFPKTFKFLWPSALKTYGDGISWLNFLESQQRRFLNQKDVFRFYWTIYKGYQKKINDESQFQTQNFWFRASSCISVHDSLLERCISNRIKLRVDKTEYEMIRVIEEKWIPFTVKSKTVFWISNVENFVKDVFVCRDSLHSTKRYNYEITVGCAAHFILLMRHLYNTTDLFNVTDVVEHKNDPNYKKIEFQLWLQFTFRNIEGFGEDNVEGYFTDSEEKMRGAENYEYIKKNFPK